MKCSKIQRLILRCDEDELSPELLLHVEGCPACRRVYRRTCDCRRLVYLKRYEVPSELRREACLSRLHDLLVEANRDAAAAYRGLGVALHPGFRYGAAAALLVLLALQIANLPRAPSLRSAITDRDLSAPSLEEFLADHNRRVLAGPGMGGVFAPSAVFPVESLAAPQRRAKKRPPSIFFASDEPSR